MSQYANIDIRDGVSQTERFPRALHPAYFKIDERDIGQLLHFTTELAELFNYYNINDQQEGTWEDFFDLDMDVLITLIARIDIKSRLRTYEALNVLLQKTELEEELIAALNKMLFFIYDAILLLVKARKKANHARNSNNRIMPISGITDDCYQLSATFTGYYRQLVQVLPGIRSLDLQRLVAEGDVLPAAVEVALFDSKPSVKDIVRLVQPLLNNLFAELRQKYSRLVIAAQYYLKHAEQQKVYDAHLGLYMAFLHLYEELQQQMNHITARHLDYYYQQILGIRRLAPVPDKVHLVCQAAPAVSQLFLPKGEWLLAEMPVTKDAIVYQTDQDVIISQAFIKELKTGFVSSVVQFPIFDRYQYRGIKEFRVYQGSYPAVSPALFSAGGPALKPWPLMGEEQADLPLNKRTMEDATLGLLLSSPLLYVRDGMRYMQVKFYLDDASYRYFLDYIRNFAGLTRKDPVVMVHQLLSKAFVIHLTGDEGWLPVPRYSLRFEMDNATDPYIELNFKLSPADKPVGVYNQEVHGGGYQLEAPALKLEVNNAAFHNAFGFLRHLFLNRITIKAEVTGSREIQVQNNIGPLSAATSFQPFGPVPATGSYLDIRNANIFNRFTKDFSVQLEWFDLPNKAGGFETYYEGYNNKIDNDSFTVRLGPLHNGRMPAAVPSQQVFSLFQTRYNESRQAFLRKETLTPVMDGSNFFFTNNLLLQLEKEETGLFKEGAVRMELLTPADAFGHRLYPLLFPAAVMHNAKRFVKKVPVPEQPYIPVVKSVEVNYTLEHSEVLKNGIRNKEETFLSIVHLYPFGHSIIYPEKDTAEICCMPPIDESSNLLIGLQQVLPGQELSFFFQVEEMKYHHTAHETGAVEWSYLKNNKWISLKPADVLSDSTNNFIDSGIVVLKLPADLQPGNTILSSDCCWLKAMVRGAHTASGRVVAVFTQAVSATRVMAESAAPAAGTWLPPGAVKGFKRKIPDVLQVWQLFSSAGGRAEETKQQYYLRVSERLRHKQRPLTSLDIAQVILDAFPDIMMVKCFGAGMSRHLVLPGINLQVIVIPREKEDGQFISKEPRVSLDTLLSIKKYISSRLSVFTSVEVGNPVYERIKVVCSIHIKKDGVNGNEGYYIKLLNEDLSRFINPWLYGEKQELKIGGKIYIADILDDIKKRPYVDYVTAFSVLHFYNRQDRVSGRYDAVVVDSAVEKISYLEASRPDAVLISADTHLITILETTAYADASASGIGQFIVGDELTIYRRTEAGSTTETSEAPAEELFDIHITL